MGKISIKKRLDSEIKRIEERLNSLNSSLKTAKNGAKQAESKHVDAIYSSTGLSTALATRIYEEKKTLSNLNRVEELSLKLLELNNKKSEIIEKQKYLDKIRGTYYLLPLYNQILNLKSVVTTVKGDIEKTDKEVKKLEKQLSDKKQVKDAAENNYLKVSKEVDRGNRRIDEAAKRFNKTNESVKELEGYLKNKEQIIKEIQDKEEEKLDLLFVLENSRVLKEKLVKEQEEITISKEQIDKINKINDIEIEVKLLENKKKEVDKQASSTKKQVSEIKKDIDGIKKKIDEIEELQRSLLPSIGDSSDNLYTLIASTTDELNSLTVLLSEIKISSDEKDRLMSINESYVYELEELNKFLKENKEQETKQKEIIKEIKKEIEEAKKEEDSPSIRKVIRELTLCVDKANKEISKLKEERFYFKTKADEKNKLLNTNYAEIKLLNNKIDAFKKEHGAKTSEDIVSKIEIDIERVKLLKSAIDDYYFYDLKKKNLEQDVNESYALHHILSIRESELNTESENISYKIKDLRSEYEDFIEVFGSSIKDLRSEFNENVAHNEDLIKKIEGQSVLSLECNEKIALIDSAITQKKLELASVEDKIEVLSKEISSASDEIQNLTNGNVKEAKQKLTEKINKATTAKLSKDYEYDALKDKYDALLVLINSKKELVNKYNEQIDVFTDKLDAGLKAHAIKSQHELKSIALPKKEVDRIEKQIIDYYSEVNELEREKQVYLNMIAGKSLDQSAIRKDEEALKNVNNSIKKSINEYKKAANKNLEAKYVTKKAESIKEEKEVLLMLLTNLKEIKKLIEKDN